MVVGANMERTKDLWRRPGRQFPACREIFSLQDMIMVSASARPLMIFARVADDMGYGSVGRDCAHGRRAWTGSFGIVNALRQEALSGGLAGWRRCEATRQGSSSSTRLIT